MIEIKSLDRLRRFDNDWLSARYHFSFANYYDPGRMSVGSLRVWNDDTIRPGTGFDLHGHRDMEIITYVRRGAITHQDHLGNTGLQYDKVRPRRADRNPGDREMDKLSRLAGLAAVALLLASCHAPSYSSAYPDARNSGPFWEREEQRD